MLAAGQRWSDRAVRIVMGDEKGNTMEFILTQQMGTQVAVTCDGRFSHTFDLSPLLITDEQAVLRDPASYGKRLYEALFPTQSVAQSVLTAWPERIRLVTANNTLDAIPWEYAYGPDGFLVCDYPFVRGLPKEQRIDTPLLDQNLHIVAIPSQPFDHDVPALDIDREWLRLKESIQGVPAALTLERARPPTLEQVRLLLAQQCNRVLHFMGHGGQDARGALLCFEQENGALDAVTARQLVQRVRSTVFLVTLNACVSATPGVTPFSNLAAALAYQHTPYALGMRFSIADEDARTFSRVFYRELARGVSVEEALYQARLTLARSTRPWVVGVPVLYTALNSPAPGFSSSAGTPVVNEHQPKIEVSALPRAEGAFQGRVDELRQLGTFLTGDNRPRIITIHGGGGQGKTALAREAVERFAFAWPGGVWATSFENLPGRDVAVADLARFLGIEGQETLDPSQREQRVQALLRERRLLIVLNNVETLVEAVEANNEAALSLAEWLRQLPGLSVSLLITSRVLLGWPGEVSCELGGLSSEAGALLFRQSAPQRSEEIDLSLARQLSEKVDGHPLSLRLLGGAFNACTLVLSAFLAQYEGQLIQAKNVYVDLVHRQRTLFACIDTSVRYLDANLRDLLSGLWVFHAPFSPPMAADIFYPDSQDIGQTGSLIHDYLYGLWQRGFLAREIIKVGNDRLEFYRLLPATHLYIKYYLDQAYQSNVLLSRFGAAYSLLAQLLSQGLDYSQGIIIVAQKVRDDFERAAAFVPESEKGYYLMYWSRILQRLGNPDRALALLEDALELAQGQDRHLEFLSLSQMALIYQTLGQLQLALVLREQVLPIAYEQADPWSIAVTFHNIGSLYQKMRQPTKALDFYRTALQIRHEIGWKAGEASTLSNMASVYAEYTDQCEHALTLFTQALNMMQEVGDRVGEASTLNGLAYLIQDMEHYPEALESFQQSIDLERQFMHPDGEAAGLRAVALLLHRHLHRTNEGIMHLRQAIAVLEESGLPLDAAGHSVDDLKRELQSISEGKISS